MKLTLKKDASKQEMDGISAKFQSVNVVNAVSKEVNTKKYAGTIKLTEDPLVIQKKMRDEWDND
jgi:hypothetical protein